MSAGTAPSLTHDCCRIMDLGLQSGLGHGQSLTPVGPHEQVQGLMEIFKVEWANLYMWTERGGSAVFHVQRDKEYWARCFTALSEFWYGHVLPGRICKDVEGAQRQGLEGLR